MVVSRGVKLPRTANNGKNQDCNGKTCLDGDDIEKFLAGDLPPRTYATALEIRLQAAQSAASKMNRMLVTRSADGRVRNMYNIYGAPHRTMVGRGLPAAELETAQAAEDRRGDRRGDRSGAGRRLRRHQGALRRRTRLIGDLCRSMLIPARGHRLIVGDFSAIEARVLTSLAGDEGKLDRFREFDCRTWARHILCYGRASSRPHHVTEKSPERALGKIFELGLGYSMGGDKLLATSGKPISPTPRITSTETTRWVINGGPKSRDRRILGRARRAARAAVRNPAMTVSCRVHHFSNARWRSACSLPSGRELNYPAPVIKPGRFREPNKSRSPT